MIKTVGSHAEGRDSTSCWGSNEVTLPKSMWEGRHCCGQLRTMPTATSSLHGRKVGTNASGGILNNEGGIWWVNAGLSSSRGIVLWCTGQVFQKIPAGLSPSFPQWNHFSLSTMPPLFPFALSPSLSPLPFYFLQPPPSCALRPCSPGKTNQDTQFSSLEKAV